MKLTVQLTLDFRLGPLSPSMPLPNDSNRLAAQCTRPVILPQGNKWVAELYTLSTPPYSLKLQSQVRRGGSEIFSKGIHFPLLAGSFEI